MESCVCWRTGCDGESLMAWWSGVLQRDGFTGELLRAEWDGELKRAGCDREILRTGCDEKLGVMESN